MKEDIETKFHTIDLFVRSILDDITKNKKNFNIDDENYKKNYTTYMINRFVSMVDLYVPIVNEINMYGDIPKESHYTYFKQILPKRKHFFKYIKKSKDLSDNDKECICEYFECSMKDAEQYINTMTQDQINKIVKVYEHKK